MCKYVLVCACILKYVFVSIGITVLSAGIVGISAPCCKATTIIHSSHRLPAQTPYDPIIPIHCTPAHRFQPLKPPIPDPHPTQFSCQARCMHLSCHSYNLPINWAQMLQTCQPWHNACPRSFLPKCSASAENRHLFLGSWGFQHGLLDSLGSFMCFALTWHEHSFLQDHPGNLWLHVGDTKPLH